MEDGIKSRVIEILYEAYYKDRETAQWVADKLATEGLLFKPCNLGHLYRAPEDDSEYW